MIKKILQYRLVSLLSLVSFAFTAGGFFWVLGAFYHSSSEPLILHFNDSVGITAIGSFASFLLIGVLGMVIVVVNFFVALELEARDRFLGKVVAVMTLVIATLLFLAFAAIIRVN